VILRYLDEILDGPVRRTDPFEHAVETMLIAQEGPFTMAGYLYVMNQTKDAADQHREKLLGIYRSLNDFLTEHNPNGTWLFDGFGLAEAVFTPMFMRFWFLEYYEDFKLPKTEEYARVHVWQDACMLHPAAQQVCREEIVKLYYDYALGAGNGALPEGRSVSSFAFQPDWSSRPWPPQNKFTPATDAELGLT
jgi:glutathione S-transferase